MVIVNTVVILRENLGCGQREVALTLASYGGDSMLAALLIPRLLDRIIDRAMMTAAAAMLTARLMLMAIATALFGDGAKFFPLLLTGWFVMGIAYPASVTPSGRLLTRSANSNDRPAIFASQFALSHVCWLSCYPLAGQIGAQVGQVAAFGVLVLMAGIGTIAALRLWPSDDPAEVAHRHDDLAPDHQPLHEGHTAGAASGHVFTIDDYHPQWPRGRR